MAAWPIARSRGVPPVALRREHDRLLHPSPALDCNRAVRRRRTRSCVGL